MVAIMAPKIPPQTTDEQDHYLGEWLEHLDFDFVKLARLLRVNKSTITRWASGERKIKLHELRRAAIAMGQRPDALLHHPNDQNPGARASRISDSVLGEILKDRLGN